MLKSGQGLFNWLGLDEEMIEDELHSYLWGRQDSIAMLLSRWRQCKEGRRGPYPSTGDVRNKLDQ